MAEFSITLQTKIALFHAKSKTLTEGAQSGPYESLYKSSHSTVGEKDVWSDTVAYAVNIAAADAEAAVNPAVTKHTQVDLTAIPGSNNQAWYFDNAGTFEKPWIAPTDIPNATTNAPSYGYQLYLYQQDLTIIPPTAGRWVIDYYAGIVQFESGFTPQDLGYALPIKATIYQYTGNFAGGGGGGGASFNVSQVAHGFTTLTPIYHNGATWVAAQADSSATLATHLVVIVSGVDAFTAAALGKYTIAAHGLTVGEYYYTDDAVAGNLVSTQPNTFSNPILYVEDADTIHVLHYRPNQSGAMGIAIASDGIEEAKIAGEDVTANKVVYIDNITEEVFLADRTVPSHEDRVYGITRNAALATEQVDVRTFGELEDLTWTWTPTSDLYVDTVGNLTEGTPAAGFRKYVGTALTATKIFINFDKFGVESIGSVPDVKIDCGPLITTPYNAYVEIDCGSFI